MTNTTDRAAAIAKTLELLAATRAEVAAFEGTGFVIAKNDSRAMTLTQDEAGNTRFAATNTPRTFSVRIANAMMASWNKHTNGMEYDMAVTAMTVETWKWHRLIEIETLAIFMGATDDNWTANDGYNPNA